LLPETEMPQETQTYTRRRLLKAMEKHDRACLAACQFMKELAPIGTRVQWTTQRLDNLYQHTGHVTSHGWHRYPFALVVENEKTHKYVRIDAHPDYAGFKILEG
jgi:hypothetical protein